MNSDLLKISDKTFLNRLFLGTGKFSSGSIMKTVIDKISPGFVTVALRRIDFNNNADPILSYIDNKKHFVIPNTSGANNSDEAVKIARICSKIGGHKWIKLEIHPDNYHLMPDPVETFKASEILVKEGFKVLPYIHADPVLAKRLVDIGCPAVMPLGAPIGTNMGIQTLEFIKIIIEQSNVPVIIDAGIGKPSDAAKAMEIGAAGVLINTAVSISDNPIELAESFDMAVRAGRKAFLAGLPAESSTANPSSSLTGFLFQK